MNSYTCPVCGYSGLDQRPYETLTHLPVPETLAPPYAQHFGEPSYEVCDCCGFEFGNDDEPGTAAPVTFSEYRQEWLSDGASWFYLHKRPQQWSADEQLKRAGIRWLKATPARRRRR